MLTSSQKLSQNDKPFRYKSKEKHQRQKQLNDKMIEKQKILQKQMIGKIMQKQRQMTKNMMKKMASIQQDMNVRIRQMRQQEHKIMQKIQSIISSQNQIQIKYQRIKSETRYQKELIMSIINTKGYRLTSQFFKALKQELNDIQENIINKQTSSQSQQIKQPDASIKQNQVNQLKQYCKQLIKQRIKKIQQKSQQINKQCHQRIQELIEIYNQFHDKINQTQNKQNQAFKQLTNHNATVMLISQQLIKQNSQLTEDINQLKSSKSQLQQEFNQKIKLLQKKIQQIQDSQIYHDLFTKISNLLKIQANQLMQDKQIIVTKIQKLIQKKDQVLTNLVQNLMKKDVAKQLIQKCQKRMRQVMQSNIKSTYTYKEVLHILTKCEMLSNKQNQQLLSKRNIQQQNQKLRLQTQTLQIDQLHQRLNKKVEQNIKLHILTSQIMIQRQMKEKELFSLNKSLLDQKKLKEHLNILNQENCKKVRQLSTQNKQYQRKIQQYQRPKQSDSFISSI